MRYRWPADIGHVIDGERIVIALLPDGIPKALIGSGAAIWLCADGSTADEIAERLATAYGVDPAALLGSVEDFSAELLSLGFLAAE